MTNVAYQILKFFVSALVPYLVRFVEPNACHNEGDSWNLYLSRMVCY